MTNATNGSYKLYVRHSHELSFFSLRNLRAFILAAVLVTNFLTGSYAQPQMSQDPGHKQYFTISGVRFSCPKQFTSVAAKQTQQLVYMSHDEYDLGLFVAVPEKPVDAGYQKELSVLIGSYLVPKGKSEYAWKQKDPYGKVSKFEVGGAEYQGFDGQHRVIVTFREFDVKKKHIIVGYVFDLGGGSEAKKLFDQNLSGDSAPGWYAQAHVIASITGEKYEQINPGSSFKATPSRPKN